MAWLLMLKQLENLSDENVVLQWKRNHYYQYFCWMNDYCSSLPCDPTELVKFRNRIGQACIDAIFGASVSLHSETAKEERVIIDTTAHEKNVTYPTDEKLAIKIINRLHKIAKREGIALRRTYVKEIKWHRITLLFFRHPEKKKRATSAMRRLCTIAKTLILDLERHFDNREHKRYSICKYCYKCDRGYRGIKHIGETTISILGVQLKRDTEEQKEAKRKKFRRRAAIEPLIGHLKNLYRLSRNYLRGFMGDQINLLMATCAWNMKK